MDLNRARLKDMEAQLEVWAARIDDIAAAAQKSNGWAGIDLRQGIDDLKIKRALFRTKLDEYQVAGNDTRESLRKSLDGAWHDLEEAFEQMTT